ncbi:MAG: hypothetical protein ACI4D0_03330 [Lachnospira sp.]
MILLILWIILRVSFKRYLRKAAFDVRARALISKDRLFADRRQGTSGQAGLRSNCSKVIRFRTCLGYSLVRKYREIYVMGVEIEDIHGFVERFVNSYRILWIRLDIIAVLLGCTRELKARINEISKGCVFSLDLERIDLDGREPVNVIARITGIFRKNNRLKGTAAIEFQKMNKQFEEILKNTG